MEVELSNVCPLDTPHLAQLNVNSDLNLLPQVLAWFDQFRQPTVPYLVWLQCQLALAEGFTNAVRHAHRDKPVETPIEIEVKTWSQAIELRIWDVGSGFDLQQFLDNLPPQVDEDAEGGRGLKIIKRMSDTFSYTRMPDHRNCLLIGKNFSPLTER